MVWVIVAVVAVGVFAATVLMLRRRKGESEVGKTALARPEPEMPTGGGREALGTSVRKEEAEIAAPGESEPAGVEVGAPRKIGASEAAEPSGAIDGSIETPRGAGEVREGVEMGGAVRTEDELPEQAKAELEEAARLLDELRDMVSAVEGVDSAVEGSVEIMGEGLQEVRALTEKGQWSQARDKGAALRAQLSLLLQSARREPSA